MTCSLESHDAPLFGRAQVIDLAPLEPKHMWGTNLAKNRDELAQRIGLAILDEAGV